jgi:hypothetical protein
MKLHKRPVLISGKLSTNEIFDLFQTWQLSILSWSIISTTMKYTRRSHGGTLSLRELELRMASSRDGVAASWFRNSEEGKCGKDRDFDFRLF